MQPQRLFVDTYHAGDHVLGRTNRRVKLDKLALRIGRRVLFAAAGFFRHSIHTLNIARGIIVDKVLDRVEAVEAQLDALRAGKLFELR